jgi:thiamine-monophosphate kinase
MREFALLQHVYASNRRLGARVLIPPGDDMGMVLLNGRNLLAAVDQLIDGRHIDLKRVDVALAGRKAVARSVSDIAAMAARPVASLAAVALPPDFSEPLAKKLFDSMRQTASQLKCPLIGGDIAVQRSKSHPMMASVTVLAEPIDDHHPPITRSGAKVGDRVYVTGTIGGGWDGEGGGKHLTFTPRVRQAIALARKLGPNLHAMIDISDGLGRDASHIAEMSRVRIEIDAERIPKHESRIAWRDAASRGEDYELLFTATGPVPNRIASVAITELGRVVGTWSGLTREDLNSPATWRVAFLTDGRAVNGATLGWEHAP